MQITLDLPDSVAAGLSGRGIDVSRAALEAIAIEQFREHLLSADQLRQVLGFDDAYDLDGFLKQREVWLDYRVEDLGHDIEVHEKLGL